MSQNIASVSLGYTTVCRKMEDAFRNGESILVQHITKYPVECILLYLGISVGCFSIKLSNNDFGDYAIAKVW